MPCKVAAFVPKGNKIDELDLNSSFSSSELRTMSLATAYALVAAEEAIKDSKWVPISSEDKEKTGVAVGMGMADLNDIINTGKSLDQKYSKVSPYFIPKILTNMAAGHISIKYGFQGPNHSVSTACATGAHAIGDSFRMIKYGDSNVMICGGTEASITPVAMAGFCRLRALSTKYNGSPSEASRPFDSGRDGFVMGEGAGILVLEEYEHARNRNASIYAEILGYGLSGDAYHMTAPRDDGHGAKRAMANAIKEGKVEADEIGYINAHATSTPIGDAIEVAAIKNLFQDHSKNFFVSSTKGATGHLLGAAGAVESIFTILACHSCYIPPTCNLTHPDEKFDLDLVPVTAKPWYQSSKRRVALCNSFGFGGTNASLCISCFSS